MKRKLKYIIGIDEAGRGSLAGPVTAAAVIATVNSQFQIPNFKSKLRDSKKLTPRQREVWFRWIKKHSNILQNVRMFYATANVSPKVIDKVNISNAANLAATKAFNKLLKKQNIGTSINGSRVFLDGGLYLNKSKIKNKKLKTQIKNIKTIIKGDQKVQAIMLASIIAKVTRDRLMKKLHKKYPKYGFSQHKGYGTKKHIKAIKKFGLSPIHRRSFRVG